jgi:hypothetical protein
MDFVESALEVLGSTAPKGYHAGARQATEPTALAAIALVAHGRAAAARPLVDWLASRQSAAGDVGINAEDNSPGWPTGWSVLAWQAAQNSPIVAERYATAVQRGVNWMLGVEGSIYEHIEHDGHDASIKGWPWVEGTHAWVEPTAMNLLALRQTGHDDHLRAREAALLLMDRLLDTGGCNYGNTVVFGQALRPHLEPTGLCMLALAGCEDRSGRIDRSLEYLASELNERTTSISLSYALLGLAAHGRPTSQFEPWLERAARRTLARDPSAYKLALLALAALGDDCPLILRTEVRLS